MTTPHTIIPTVRRGARLAVGAAVLLAASACTNLLDVKNPNNIAESSLDNPAAAGPEANGLLASTTQMLGATTLVYADATDEQDWIGSRDAWGELDQGIIGDFVNEFSDAAFPQAAEARYLAEKTIARLEGFDAAGTLKSKADLMRSYVYGAVVYASIADMYDDFAFSDKTVAKAPIGRANMGTLYDQAVAWLDKALPLAASSPTDQYNILAYRARVKHGKGAWQKVTPVSGTAPANPLVNDAGAVADANAAIAIGTADQEFTLFNNVEAANGNSLWFEVNGRNESAPGAVYVVDPRSTTNKYVAKLADPITGAPDPWLQSRLTAFHDFGTQEGTLWLTNTREMHLILAEAALAAAGGNGADATFRTQINIIRAQDGVTAYSGQITGTAMLAYERQAQLWLMRRRLIDMYRFGQTDPVWVASPNYDSSINKVGLLFPIAYVERLANPCVADPSKCP